jgi:O-acetyl-ADP-ribose deacetylase (regulator of RNase III)
MKTIKGNLVKAAKRGDFDVIIHGCNCFCQMGAGIAKQIKETFPRAYEADLKTKPGDRDKLGTCTVAEYEKVHIVNAYTQFRYGNPKRCQYADYDAIRSCLTWVKQKYSTLIIGMPQIGCGLAGGDWYVVEQIINEVFGPDEDVTVMFL